MTGKVHSIQSMGTLDGPGVRFVIFLQGCNLRCSCCHNPDTWDCTQGTEYSAEELVQKALHYREYFGTEGGITVSGGEPLLQSDFVQELFSLCHEKGVNTCLDTSGSILNESIKALLDVTDRVLLDIKYTHDADYVRYVGCSMDKPMAFLEYLNKKSIPTTLRQVIIPTLNDAEENISALKKIIRNHSCISKAELLPFRKICQTKYDAMGIKFPFTHLDEPTHDKVQRLIKLLESEDSL